MTWDRASRRRAELPPDWPAIRTHILRRDHYTCQIRNPGCTRRANQVDHIGDRLNHMAGNLRATCGPCHTARTAQQGHQAARTARAKALHPVEKNPGLR